MSVLFWVLISTFLVSLLSFVGVLSLLIKDKILEKILSYLVALSIGGLMAGAFLHLIPEALEQSSSSMVFFYVLIGFFLFFLVEKILHWRHCHKQDCPLHPFVYMNLFGDGVHNFIDGLLMAATFVVNIKLGIATTLAIALHEIPQEIGDFGVLIYGGFKKKKAVLFNFLNGVTAVLGGILGYYLSSLVGSAVSFLIPFTAGGFIYIAASDLIPEIRKELNVGKSLLSFAIIGFGILIFYILKIAAPE